MAWQGTLRIQYQRRGDHTIAHDLHDGPLRVLRALYPEGPGVCHHVLVHPPGGLVGGDDLTIQLDLAAGAHALITTPGATRFYRSAGDIARQRTLATLGAGARLEWLPLETILHDHARGHNQVRFNLDATAQMMGWDMLALGLPASNEVFEHGRFEQQIKWPDVWLERGVLDHDDPRHRSATQRLLHSPLGWHGRSVLATMWLASGSPWATDELNQLIDATRATCLSAEQQFAVNSNPGGHPSSAALCGVSSPNSQLIVLRLLAHRTEMAWPILRAVRSAWRQIAWHLDSNPPRIWST